MKHADKEAFISEATANYWKIVEYIERRPDLSRDLRFGLVMASLTAGFGVSEKGTLEGDSELLDEVIKCLQLVRNNLTLIQSALTVTAARKRNALTANSKIAMQMI